MTPQVALENPIFLFYLKLLAGILTTAGLFLGILRFVFKKNISSVWATYRSWLIMVPLILGCLMAGRIPTIIFFILLAGLAYKDFSRATGIYTKWWFTIIVYLALAVIGTVAIMKDPVKGYDGWFGMFRTLPVFVIPTILLIPILRNQTKGQLQVVSLSILGFVYIGWMMTHTCFFANSDNPYGYLLFLLFATEINDIAAFTFGKTFGKHKLRSEISPNKTWEGAIGALCVSMILPWVLPFSFPHFGPLQKILTGLIIGIGGQLGDLSISLIKRDIGIKDMGALIPGHGGILDRIDSLIFSAPLFLHMVNYFYGIYGIRG